MDLTYSRDCPICGNNPKTLLYRQEFADIAKVSFLKGYDIVLCNGCGFAFADNIPSQNSFDTYYERQSKYERTSSELVKARLDIMQNDLAFINRFSKSKKDKILEIGCGPGNFLIHLKENGFSNLTAIEPSRHCVDRLNRDFGIRAFNGVISKTAVGETFDLIILLTVLEHIVDLEDTVRNISGMLRRDGLLFIRVPNACKFADYDDSPFQQFSPEHINYFSVISIRNLLGKHGYKLLAFEEAAMSESDDSVLPMINIMLSNSREANDFSVERDTSIKIHLEKYIELSAMREREIDRKIMNLAISQEPIVVWGTGTHTLRLLELGALRKCNIVAFIDSNVHYDGGSFNNIPVKSPRELHNYTNKVLISSKVFQTEIANFIRDELKAANELVLLY